MEVLGFAPFRLRVDVHPLNEAGEESQVQGDMKAPALIKDVIEGGPLCHRTSMSVAFHAGGTA
jgi:hypothetical protein